jgi:hypothetical protein
MGRRERATSQRPQQDENTRPRPERGMRQVAAGFWRPDRSSSSHARAVAQPILACFEG